MTKTIERPGISVPPEIVDDLTRREFLIGAGLLALAPGCGAGEEATNGGEETSGQTRTIEHKYGATEISGVPKRVVTVGLVEQDTLLALGVAPVATREWLGEQPGAIFPWAEEQLGDADLPEIVGTATEFNVEQIAALEPDLIVGLYSGLTEQEYETLSEIAPTMAQPESYADYGVPWQEQTRIIGRAVGREGRAEELIEEVEAQFQAVREAHPEFEGASGLVGLVDQGSNYFLYGPQDLRGRFMTALGFEIPDKVVEAIGDLGSQPVSRERLDLADVDVMIWRLNDPAVRDKLQDETVYQRLDVAQEGRDVFLDRNAPLGVAISFSTVLSLPFALDGLVPMLAAAIDGDPGTEAAE